MGCAMDDRQSIVVITGAAGHIGLACARRFPGRPLLLCDLFEGPLQTAAASLADHGAEVRTHSCDLTRNDQALALAAVASQMGHVGVLIHAAGVAPPSPPDLIYAVNLFATRNLLSAFQPQARAGDVAVCIASLAGHRRLAREFDALLLAGTSPQDLAQRIQALAPEVNPSRLAYAASKRATILMCQAAAVAWGKQEARVLSVSPGVVGDTAMGAARKSTSAHAAEPALPRPCATADIADAVAFAASPAAGYMTGVDLLVDGGFLATVDHRLDPEQRRQWHAVEV